MEHYLTQEKSFSQESTLLTCGLHAVPSHEDMKERKADFGLACRREAGDTHTLARVTARGRGEGMQLCAGLHLNNWGDGCGEGWVEV